MMRNFDRTCYIASCLAVASGSIQTTRPVDRIVGRWDTPPSHVPTTGVPDGPLLGNGRFGAVATWSKTEEDAEVAFHFGHNAFFAAPTTGISSCGYEPGGRKALGGLALRFHNTRGAIAAAEQWPGNATVTVRFSGGSASVVVTAFLHALEDSIVVEVSSLAPLEASATLWTYSGCHGERRPIQGSPVSAKDDQWVSLSCSPKTDRLHTEGGASLRGLRVSRANGWPYQAERFNVQWFTLIAGSSQRFSKATVLPTCYSDGGPCARGWFHLPQSGSTTLAVDLIQRPLTGDAYTDLRNQADIPDLWRSHSQSWIDFWKESSMELPSSPITELFWYMSQYLLKSSSSGDASPGLFGPFVIDDQVSWLGDLTLNYNAEAVYYGAASSNHLSVFEPYFRTILDYLPTARVLAQGQTPDCEGALYFPGHILPYGVTGNGKGDMGQKQMGLFATVPFVFYWRATRDASFAERALPFLQGISKFWECSLTLASDGWLHDMFDCAEELCIPDGNVQPDPTITLSFLPALFETVAEMTSALGRSGDQYKWQAIADRIAPYPTVALDGKAVIADHMDGDGIPVAWSGLFASFPLGSVGPTKSQTTVEIALRSIDRFFREWPGGKQGNSFVHAFPAAARLGWRPAELFLLWEAYLKNTSDPDCRMYANGMVLGCGGTGLENVGGTAYVNEMMLQSHEGFLRIFPTLPPGMEASFHRFRADGGFLVSARISSAGELSNVTIEAPAEKTSSGARVLVPALCVLMAPWRGATVLVNDAPHPVDNGVLRFSVRPGIVYSLVDAQSEASCLSECPNLDGSSTNSPAVAASSIPHVRFVEHKRNAECTKGVPGVEAAIFSLGGGDHSFEACQEACLGASDCLFMTFFHTTGYCHMFARCDGATPAGDGCVTYTRQ